MSNYFEVSKCVLLAITAVILAGIYRNTIPVRSGTVRSTNFPKDEVPVVRLYGEYTIEKDTSDTASLRAGDTHYLLHAD